MQIVGIDISKATFDAAIFRDGKMPCKQFSNCLKGFEQLQMWLAKNHIEKTSVCMEATGFYGENLAEFLYSQGHKVSVINPSCIAAYSCSRLSRHKTDKFDSVVIAEYASKHDLASWKPVAPVVKELRQLHRCMESLKQQLVQVTNHLENSNLCDLVKKSWEELARHIRKQLKDLDNSANRLVTSDKSILQDYNNLQTIPGISKTTALAVIAEIPDLSSFKDARQLAAYAGLVPKQRTSGSSVRGNSRLSKLGSVNLRKSLYFPAIVAKKHNPIIAIFCQRLLSKGKSKMAVVCAAMRKLLHIIFGILKSKKTFDVTVGC
jgi:transposase